MYRRLLNFYRSATLKYIIYSLFDQDEYNTQAVKIL